ncbi:hypothetical protein ACMA1I_19270 [Pontibacter sp. 13R65]|uniref:hypothetical protein n=1 Tax=Pontibacter sp. 13R65 TaxID=3127458 RepID=UPI00301BE765
MGAEIHISLESDKYDDKELAPFLGRDFYFEITRGAIWEGREPFLNELEVKLLKAPYYEEFEDESVKLVNPVKLRIVLEKVKRYLDNNRDSLAFEIDIDFERMKKEGLITDLIINESRCWIKGDSFYYNVTDKVEIVNYPMEPAEISIWINYSEEIIINNKKYFLEKTTRFEKFAAIIDKVIDFCKNAEKNNERVYWLYSH